jgi:hypothetical protein
MQEIPLNEQQLRRITERFWGIRYKYDKQGRFIAYANAGTLIIDCFKKLFNVK